MLDLLHFVGASDLSDRASFLRFRRPDLALVSELLHDIVLLFLQLLDLLLQVGNLHRVTLRLRPTGVIFAVDDPLRIVYNHVVVARELSSTSLLGSTTSGNERAVNFLQ